MENLVKTVSEKTGITETQAKTAVETVGSFLKDKMPAGVGAQAQSFLQGSKNPVAEMAGGLKDKVSDTLIK